MTRLVNLTSHPVVLKTSEGETSIPVWRTARMRETHLTQSTLTLEGGASCAIILADYPTDTTVDHLPPPVEGVLYIVPKLVARERGDREDLVFPLKYLRTKGVVTRCEALGRFPAYEESATLGLDSQ